ncbi:hypothetical protein KH5_23180 [Urechidicola sp. KH5]
MKKLLLILCLFFTIQESFSQFYKDKEPFTHTYSIVARDSITGEMGVAVQSHWFSVGSLVTYGKAGVGVVATQSLVNPSYGPNGLKLMEKGLTPQQALDSLMMIDEGAAYRQVAFLNKDGLVASHTGDKCITAAGHVTGPNFSVQANMMLRPTVWDAMANAFKTTEGSLAERMLAAMKAAEKEGGDIRGKQSAAMLIVKPESTGNSWEDTVLELRIEDYENPIRELERLLKVHKAYDFMNQGDIAMEHGDSEKAEQLYLSAQKLFPKNLEMKFWYAINLLNNEDYEKAHPILKDIFFQDNHWRLLTERLVHSELLTIPHEEVQKVLKL